MQKKIIALAIAAAFSAPAFADTTVYGIVDAAIAHASADKQHSDTQLVSGGLSTSRLGFKSVEELSNGMKAVVVVEFGLNAEQSSANTSTTGSSLGASTTANYSTSGIGAARQQMLALAGDFGTVATGYLQTAAYDWAVKYNPTEGSTVSPLGNMAKGGGFLISSITGANRASRAIAYLSNDYSGLTFAVNYASALSDQLGNLGIADTTTGTKIGATLLSVNYATGPLSVGGVYAKTAHDNPATADNTEYALGASYDFRVAKVFVTYQSDTPTGGSASKAESISAVIPAGPGAVAVSYAKAAMATTGTGASGETVAYLYDMSKTVTVYGAYSKVSQDSAANKFSVYNDALAGTTAGSSSLLAVGLRKKF